jgi:Ni/Fe-hydrogenase subunit HybB-like protein
VNRNVDMMAKLREKLFLGMSFRDYLSSLITPFNAICTVILAVGIPVIAYRIIFGLGASTNLSDNNPWGLWIGFDMITGVAVATGGFVIGTAVHLFGLKEYRPFVRPALLTGFLGYTFAILGLILDLGRYYRLPYPMFVSLGVGSILFLVAWCLSLYCTCQFVELCPAICEWLNLRRLRKYFNKLTIGASVLAVILSTEHQSALGTIFILMPGKLHPLWYSSFIPVYFFVSSIIAGISMVILESSLSHKFFGNQVKHLDHDEVDRLIIGLGKAAAALLFTYFFMKLAGVAHGNHWRLLTTPYGYLFLLEVVGFVLLPALLYSYGVRMMNANWVRWASLPAVFGVIFNRLNHTIIAFNWNGPEVYYPSWMEVMTSLTLITIGVLTFRWIVNRMPILYDHPAFEPGHG